MPDFVHGEPASAGVLLVNLGTPNAPTPAAVRRYLAEFLADPRVVEQPRWLWWPILHGVILCIRPARSAHAYRKIWTEAGSPLLVGTRALAERVQASMAAERPGPIRVAFAMRYGDPSVASVLRGMRDAGVRRLLVLPLYPQYSATTTASAFDAIASELARWRWPPELRLVNDYYADERYIEALARSIERHWAAHGRAERLLLSFHGIPQRYVRAGDPYFCHVQGTARRLRERLRIGPDELVVTFQSRVGREPWLAPYTDLTLAELARAGVRRVQVACPGFAVDCLETLEEIAMANAALFLGAGGERFEYIPALNDSPDHVDALTALALRHGQGWAEFDPSWSASADAARRAEAKASYDRVRDDAR